MARENKRASARAGTNRVSPDRGFYTDPGEQDGIRYWDGQGWSPLLPAGIAGDRLVGKFPAPVMALLPAPDGSWDFAARQARRHMNQSRGFAAAAAVAAAAGLLMQLSWLLYFAALFAVRIFSEWRTRKRWLRIDQAARGLPVAIPDAASRARQAQVLFIALLTAGAITLAGSLALFDWGTNHHNNYTWSSFTFWAGVFLLWSAWVAAGRRNTLRKIDQADNAAPEDANTADSTVSPPPGEPGEGLSGAGLA